MATSVSAKKRVRQNIKNRAINRAVRSKIKTGVTGFFEKKDVKDTDANGLISMVDKAWKAGVLHKNNAARKKSRIMKKMAQTKKAGETTK